MEVIDVGIAGIQSSKNGSRSLRESLKKIGKKRKRRIR